jgi:uncharacterized protein YutE (UPF0331/DUF86 family)
VAAGKAKRTRWRSQILSHLDDFSRQYGALENAMAAFGDDFDLKPFKAAFETMDDMEAYNRVQAVERALGRVQNFVVQLADAGVSLAELDRPPKAPGGSPADAAFEALRAAKVIDGNLCRRLKQAQRARSRIEHGYVRIAAGDVHRTAELVHDSALRFIGAYRRWIVDHLDETGSESLGDRT